MITTDTHPIETQAKLALTAKLFRGFADPSRLAILELLRDGERCVSDLVGETGLSQPNVSGHLTCLKDCGLVAARQQGRFVYYRLADPEVAEVLANAHGILARLADRIAACVNYDRTDPTPDEEARP
jgi:ArsR family transcriptional regulator, cadmium/lead-responsive transcriptional repressor